MIQNAILTERMVKETLGAEKGEMVIERAPSDYGEGWIITMEVRGVRCVVIATRTPTLRVFREVNSAVGFIERNNPDQGEIRILRREATDIPSLRLPPKPDPKPRKPTRGKSSKPARKASRKRT